MRERFSGFRLSLAKNFVDQRDSAEQYKGGVRDVACPGPRSEIRTAAMPAVQLANRERLTALPFLGPRMLL